MQNTDTPEVANEGYYEFADVKDLKGTAVKIEKYRDAFERKKQNLELDDEYTVSILYHKL